MAATPIRKPTRSSVALPPKTMLAPSPVKPMTRNMDQIAANDALLYPKSYVLLAAATAIETIT